MPNSPVVDMGAIMAQFRAAASARGLLLPDHIDADGKLHRCELRDGPKGKKDGSYLLHLDGVPAGGFQNFKDGIEWENWRADIGRQLTPEEEAASRARIEAQRVARETEAKAKRDKARRKANAIWNSAKPAPDDHPYLLRKGVPAHGLRVGAWPKWDDHLRDWRHIPNALLVPMRSPSGTLHSLQAIFADKVDGGRDKDFLPAGEKAGKFHLIGEVSPDKPLCGAEGYATATSIHQATGWPVAVAFDAGSLEAAAKALQEAYPAARFILCADDDSFGHCFACKAPVRVEDGDTCPACGEPHKRCNAGQIRAREAAQAVGGVVVSPRWPDPAARWEGFQQTGKAPTDFNDLHQISGLDAVRQILAAARTALKDVSDGSALFLQTAGGLVKSAPAATLITEEAVLPPDPEPVSPVPDAAPEASQKPPAKPARKTRSKASADGVKQAASGGEVFELRDGKDGRGVYRLKVERRGEGWETVEQFVCAPLGITHQVRDARGENWQRLATFHDHDGRRRRVLVPDDMLEGDGAALARLLRAQGLFIGDNKGGLLKMYVNRSRPAARARLTARIGWHEDCTEPGRWSYVLGGDADPLASCGAELWLHQAGGSGHAQFKAAGTLDDWQANVAALAVGNSRLTFALSAGFAGGLCWLHPNVSGGFHWAGGSSLGKSGLLYATASLCGPPTYRKTWLLTATAIEGVAAGHCDAPLLLDELKQAGNPRDVAQAAYMLTSGQGKGRGQAAGGLRETASFSLVFQSNGEIGLTRFLEENQERAYAGQEVRFCELPADAGAGFGCWDVLHGLPDGARFTEAVQKNASRHYGGAYPEFIRHVLKNRDAMPRQFEELRGEFEQRVLTSKAGGQVVRAATRFAAVAYAGELATEWGITGWNKGEAIKAAFRLFRDWLQAFGGEENREPRRMIEQIQSWIQSHAGARLEDHRRPSVTDTHAPRTMNRAGWKKPTKETASLNEPDQVFEYLLYPAVFRSELCNGFDPSAVAKELDKRGLLVRSKDSLMQKFREPGAAKPGWFYVIPSAILGSLDDEH